MIAHAAAIARNTKKNETTSLTKPLRNPLYPANTRNAITTIPSQVKDILHLLTEFYHTEQSEGQGEKTAEAREEQDGFIENLELPGLLQKGMEANNTDETYQYLAVDSFGSYVSGYLARTIVNGLSFLVSYLLASVIIRIGMFILDLIAGLPLIKEANKLTGALVGLAEGMLFVWIAFLVLTVLCSTEIGKKGLELIEKDVFLNIIYQYDIFINFFMKI